MVKMEFCPFYVYFLVKLVYIKQIQKIGEFSHQVELEKAKDESESARCRNCSRIDICSLARINTAGRSSCMSYNFYFFNFAKLAIELNIHVAK